LCPKEFPHNNYATKKTITQGLLDIALLTANASQLKFVLEVGESHPYYVLLVTLLAISIALQVITACFHAKSRQQESTESTSSHYFLQT
jgi:hypothetical protein